MLENVLFDNQLFYLGLKVAILISLAFYIVFAFVITRQVYKMTHTLEVGFENQLRFLSLLHLIFSIGIFILGFIII